MDKVTNPLKKVTDPVLLSGLAKQGIDKDYVEFYQDYAMPAIVNGKKERGKSPSAKFYRDLKSNKRFMVASGLPMVDANGFKIECGWKVAGINYFAEKNNLFRAKVQDTQVEITIRNDQPDGRKANDKLSFKPQLFLDSIEQTCGNSVLLPVDPVNPNYLENTLEWDYGICKRRLRIIEGAILGSWVFASKPNGEVRIKYNQVGDYRLKLGQFKINDDEEQVTPEQFDELTSFTGYPVTISDSATFYPDAHPETSSVDGTVYEFQTNSVAWATIIAAAGTGFNDSATDPYSIHFQHSSAGGNLWRYIRRGIFLFDTSGLPDDAVISAATLSLYGATKTNNKPTSPVVNIYSSAPASNTALAAGDYDSLGSTAFCDTGISYASWSTVGYNDFALNASGIAAVTKTGVSKFGLRDSVYDVGATTPPYTASTTENTVQSWFASEQGNGYKPKLVVTYTSGWANIAKFNGVASASIAKVSSVAVASIAKLSGVAV